VAKRLYPLHGAHRFFSSRKLGSSYPYRLSSPVSGPRLYYSWRMSRLLPRRSQAWAELHLQCSCLLGGASVFGAESALIFLSSLATLSPDALTAAQEKGPEKIPGDRKAREMAGGFVPNDGPFTVADALTAYFNAYERRGGKALGRMRSATRNYILPNLGSMPVAKLTRPRLIAWHESIAASAPRVRGRTGDAPKFRTHKEDAETIRRRRSTANRVLTILKAALNKARQDGRIANDYAWAQVRAFREVDAARLRYLSDDEVRRLVNTCGSDFRALVTAALMTGCRFGELTALVVEDFNTDSGTIHIRTSKSGKPRHVAVADEGRLFFTRQCLGKLPSSRLFTRANGRPWSASDQQRPLAAASSDAQVAPITFHGLRHTYASRLAMKGVPLAVIATQLGHSDIRMVEKHYGHMAPNYVADTVRAAFGTMGIVEVSNVVKLVAG
jgi:integrase